jgi:glycosyltransferase involved in cell wall biosynthesis
VLGTLSECDLALGDSDFNRRELVAAGMPEEKSGVLPIFLSQERYEGLPVSQGLLARLRASGAVNFLAVGRVVPNKGLDDAIRIFSAYHHGINPLSRLYIVGSRHLPSYDTALDELVADLQLEGVVVFTGLVSDAELKTYFQAADIYLTASHHEGFCVPLIEAMYFGVPIVARKAGAIPETLGEAGVLFTGLGYGQVAEMAQLLVTSGALRQSIVQGQFRRLDDLRPGVAEAALWAALVRVGVGG